MYLGAIDHTLVRYGATIVGYFVLAKPSMSFFKKSISKESMVVLTKNYIRNGSLMVNLAKSIGRIVVSYKDL